MHDSAALAADLQSLTDALGDPNVDIAEAVRQLASSAGVAIASYLGMEVKMRQSGLDLGFAVIQSEDIARIRTSLRIEVLPGNATAVDTGVDTRMDSTIAVVLYAGTAGAFVDLAADVAWLTGQAATHLILDRDAPLPADAAGAATLGDLSIINQAIGLLIGRGSPPELAELELARLSEAADSNLVDAAKALLASLDHGAL